MTPRKSSTSSKAKFAYYVLDQLHLVDDVRMRPMFGGYGLYCRGFFFGLIWQDVVYFFTSSTSRRRYKRAGMGPFVFREGEKEGNYFAVPDTVLDSPKKVAEWANEAVMSREAFERSSKRS